MLENYLSFLSHSTLRRPFPSLFQAEGLVSTRGIVQKILESDFSPEKIRERFIALPPVQKEILFHLFMCDPGPCSLERLHKVHSISLEALEKEISSLQEMFFVAALKGEMRQYVLFPEILGAIRELVREDRIRDWPRRRSALPNRAPDFGSLWNDLVTFLIFCRTGKLRYTQKGFIGKRSMAELLANLQCPGELKQVNEADAFQPDVLPDRFRFLFSYAMERGLVRFGEASMEIAPRGLLWIQWSDRQKVEDLLAFALRTYVSPAENCETVFSVIGQLEEWTDIRPLINIHCERTENNGYVRGRQAVRQWLDIPLFYRILNYAGILDFSWNTGQGRIFARCTPFGKTVLIGGEIVPQAGTLLMMMPNFEAIVPPETDWALRFRLGSICEWRGFDQVYRFRITRNSVHYALQNFLTAESIRELLLALQSHFVVPANVLQTVEMWADEFGRISFSQPFVVVAKSPRLREELRGIPAVSRYFAEEISGYGFVIDKKDYDPVLQAILRAGYYPAAWVGPCKTREEPEVPFDPVLLSALFEKPSGKKAGPWKADALLPLED